jgi:hypothetical protein
MFIRKSSGIKYLPEYLLYHPDLFEGALKDQLLEDSKQIIFSFRKECLNISPDISSKSRPVLPFYPF